MNEVSSLSPFPARYTSINFTTSQSGEHRPKGKDAPVLMFVLILCALGVFWFCLVFFCLPVLFPDFFSPSPPPSAASFLLLLSGQEVA